MKQKLDELQALVQAGSLTNRDVVLKIISLWTVFKSELIAEIKKRPVTSFQDRDAIEDTIDRIKTLNIWPWGGALESILEHVGTQTILDHWNRCLNFAREELTKLGVKAA